MSLTHATRLQPSRTRRSTTEDIDLAGLTGQLTITELPDGRPAEVFLTIGKQGSTLAGVCEALSLMTSLALQYQVPLVEIVSRLINMRFEPAGLTGAPDIPAATSLADYLGRRLAIDYLDAEQRQSIGIRDATARVPGSQDQESPVGPQLPVVPRPAALTHALAG